ncbi:MAG: DNA methyltransferase [Candidatus Thorarchaeota archaeon]
MNKSLKKNLEYYLKASQDWKKYSCVSRNYPPSFSHQLRRNHGGIKPPELCLELIQAYGEKSNNIIDPFVGAGSSLIAASILGKKAIGIEINPLWYELYKKVCSNDNIPPQKYLIGDSESILKKFKTNFFDFVITDVPYFNMDKLPQTRGKFSKAGEPTKEKLPSSLKRFNEIRFPSKEMWLKKLENIFKELIPITKDNTIFLIFIGNMYRNIETSNNSNKKIGKYLNLDLDLANILEKIGLIWIKELIWSDPGKKLGIYGYPYSFIPSLLDQRILVFSKYS